MGALLSIIETSSASGTMDASVFFVKRRVRKLNLEPEPIKTLSYPPTGDTGGPPVGRPL